MKLPRSLGRYEIIDLISEGGMGALYRARDPRIGRYVAIKLLKRGYDTPEIRDRFSREAIAAGSLSHPNIVTIYDVGEDDGLPFIAMEYVRGETFADLVCLRPPLSVVRKLQLTEEVCAGLAHAHEAGIVHRDIKPANLIVGPEGTVKILDFGIAKLSASGMTLPGAIMGTLNYMSPEQVKGAAVDARADIFSLGAVLYELLSHQQAFPGEVHGEVMQRILRGVPRPITEYCPDLDPRLVRLIDRSLEKDPNRRFQEIVSVEKELASIRLTPPAGEPRPTAAPRIVSPAEPRPVTAPRPAAASGSPAPTPGDRDLSRRRAQHIEEHLAAAGQAFDVGDYDAAIESCEQVLMLDASDVRALSQIDRIHAAIDEQQILAHVAEARAELARGATEAAQQSLDAAALLAPGHPEVARARDEVQRELTRVRTAETRAAIELAKAFYEGLDLTSALDQVGHALALDPENADAQALAVAVETAIKDEQENARIRMAVDEARRRFDNGEHLDALESLESLQPASHTVVAATLEELRLAFDQIEARRRAEQERVERRRQIEVLLDDARSALKADRLDETLRVLALVREIDATAPELSDLTERVNRAQAAARLKADLESALGQFEERLAQADLPRAGDLLKTAASLAPADSRVQGARSRLDQATAALAAKEAADARTRQGEQKMDDAAARLAAGDLAGAADMLKLAAELAPKHPRAAELSERLQEAVNRQAAAEAAERLRQQVAELIRAASQRLQPAGGQAAGDLALALREITQALELDSENAEAKRLQTAIEASIAERRELARVRAVINNARRRFANGKHQAALRLLEDFQPASNSEVADTLKELRATFQEIEEQRRAERARVEKQERVAALLSDARTALGEKKFDTALGLLSNVSGIDPAVPELSPLMERVRQEQAAARLSAELDTLLADLDASTSRNDLSAASGFLNAATALNPADARLPIARQRIQRAIAAREAAEARARDVEEKRAAAERLLARGDLQDAMHVLKQQANLSSQDAPTIVISDRGSATRTPDDEDTEPIGQTVDELLAAAAEHLQSADQGTGAMLAMQKITKALAIAPGHARALALKDTAETGLGLQREAARIRAVIGNARNRFANGKHQAALQLLEDLDPSSHPIVADTLRELRSALHDMQERQRVDPAKTARKAPQTGQESPRNRGSHVEDVTRFFERGDLAEALKLARGASPLDEQSSKASNPAQVHDLTQPRAEAALRQQQEVDASLLTADRQLRSGDVSSARQLLLAILEKDPTHAWARELWARIEEREREQLEAGRRRVVDGGKAMYEDAPTIVLFQAGAADAHQSTAGEVEVPVTTPVLQEAGDGGRGHALTDVQPATWVQQIEGLARRRPSAAIAAVGVLLLVILTVLFLSSRPSRTQAPSIPPAPRPAAVNEPQPPAPAPDRTPPPAAPAQSTFAVTLTGTYPFEVVFPGGRQPSADRHTIVLPAGTSEVRLKNFEYFLDVPLSITGAARETKTVSAPPLASLTVYTWNELCELAIDGRRSGYYRLTRRVVTGVHLLSIRCPGGVAESKQTEVTVGRSEPVTFTKPN